MKQYILMENMLQKFKEENKIIFFKILTFIIVSLLILISAMEMNRLNTNFKKCQNTPPIRDTLIFVDTLRITDTIRIIEAKPISKINSSEILKLRNEISIYQHKIKTDSININELINTAAFLSDISPNCVTNANRYFRALDVIRDMRFEYRN